MSLLPVMGACCSCLDAIRGGGGGDNGKSGPGVELRTKTTTIPPPCHGISRTMSSPTIRIIPAATSSAGTNNGGKNNSSSRGGGGVRVSGCGFALGMVPVDQDAAYWEWHIHLPGKIRRQQSGKDDDDDDDDNGDGEKFANFDKNNSNKNEEEEDDDDDDPYALKFGVATRKDRNFYNTLHTETMEGSDTINTRDDGTYLMRPISNLFHGDVIGVAVQQSDLPMIQILLNGEPLSECTINRFRGLVYPAIFIPPGAGTAAATANDKNVGIQVRLEDVDDEPTSSGLYVVAEFEEENFKEMSPHARFGPLLAARGII